MKKTLVAVGSISFVGIFSAACGGTSQEAAPPPAPSTAQQLPNAVPPMPTPSPDAGLPAHAAAAPTATAATGEDAPPTAQDWADLDKSASAEDARFTPELHAAAKKAASASYPSTKAALTVLLKSPIRKPGNPERDKYRHPIETLTFIGLTPKMTVLEYGPGEGWYTELLAPMLATKGKLIVTTSDPKGPKTERGTLGGVRFERFLGKSPELFGKVQSDVVDGKHPALPEDGTLDAVLVFRGMHGMEQQGKVADWLAAIHHALKPNGILGIVQHRAPVGADPVASAKNGYLPEAWVIQQVEAAGFKLAGKSEINANPKDTKDYAAGVWTLPPTLRLKDKDRDKYLAIGESDRMTLKFVKVGK
ncbi:MAG TPA: hypothetical protein VH142_16770 [Polyangiaceae bacterium]|jgi:predicted methyltransferase|nr:hypothetical protein [Polyangiaceae bacterium]